MATGELRDRVRERLVSAEQGLARALAGAPPDRDEVVRLLRRGLAEDVELRRRRLAHALADFDSATIATTHGFCQEVLGGLGVAGDVEPGVTFVEDIGDLVEEVVDDLYLRRFHWVDGPARLRPRAGAADRPRRDRQPGDADRAARGRPGHRRRACAAGWPRRCAGSSTSASAGSR